MREAHPAAAVGLMRHRALAACLVLACIGASADAARRPVLEQIDLPHPYYFREMYLPQLTGGPSALAWSPDSKELVYSMAGSLWRQPLASGNAKQLTADKSYDYQPDWSPDGRWIVYTAYQGDALELRALNAASGQSVALTHDGAVNVEPRFSPDGRRIAFVSTRFNRRFHIFVADFQDGVLSNIAQVTSEHRSDLPRYYYSPFDHEISPMWSRDGRDIFYISNRGHLYGTGGIWRRPIAAGPDALGAARELHYEETNWKARPDISPDGSRLVFSSYTGGRSWHSLWLMPAEGGDVFPLSYGDWDQTNARWSPDGSMIAFISNRNGSTEINWVQIPGGEVMPVAVKERDYLHAHGRVEIGLGSGEAARISITDAAGMFHAPAGAWISADDGYDRARHPFESHYFHARGPIGVDVPAGEIHIDLTRGLETEIEHRDVFVKDGATLRVEARIPAARIPVPDADHWVSADVHVHMNYGGVYRNTPEHLVLQAQSEGLNLIESLIVNKEQRFPDIAFDAHGQDPASKPDATVVHGQEFHTSYWGHLGLLGMKGGILLPGYAGYPRTAASSLYPMNADIADWAHARGGLVGYVHPFDEVPQPLRTPHDALSSELPVDVALGKVDYMEILGFSDHRATQEVWYRLLNLGFKIPAAAGTDAMANFASLRGPVGMNRVYARVDGPMQHTKWLDALKRGRTFATNAPLLGFSLGGARIGDELQWSAPRGAVNFSVRMASIVTVDHLDLVCNGKVVRSFAAKPVKQAHAEGKIALNQSGWCVLRAMTDGARDEVFDNYVYATTSPIYVRIAGKAPSSAADAEYFAAWIERVEDTTRAYPDWNSPAEREGVLRRLQSARRIFTAMQDER